MKPMMTVYPVTFVTITSVTAPVASAVGSPCWAYTLKRKCITSPSWTT